MPRPCPQPLAAGATSSALVSASSSLVSTFKDQFAIGGGADFGRGGRRLACKRGEGGKEKPRGWSEAPGVNEKQGQGGDSRTSLLPSAWVVCARINTPGLSAKEHPSAEPASNNTTYIHFQPRITGRLVAGSSSLKQLASKNTFGPGKGRERGFVYFYTKHRRFPPFFPL